MPRPDFNPESSRSGIGVPNRGAEKLTGEVNRNRTLAVLNRCHTMWPIRHTLSPEMTAGLAHHSRMHEPRRVGDDQTPTDSNVEPNGFVSAGSGAVSFFTNLTHTESASDLYSRAYPSRSANRFAMSTT